MKRRLFSSLACIAFIAGSLSAQYTPKYEIIDKPDYPTKDVNVISFNILDYDASANQGTKDVTSLVQNLLNAAGDYATYPSGSNQAYRKTGGVVYLPAGQYKIKQLNIPRGVTLRGDWKQPVKGQAITGTILKPTNFAKGSTTETNGFIIMEPSTEVTNIAIWYEDQDASNVSEYPPSIVYGKQGYFGNDYCNVRDVTLVNSYIGVAFSELNGGGCPNIFGLYGSPLYKGVAMDNIADVGRFDHIDFSPKYWEGSGLSNAGDASSFIYDNGIGFEMRRNDWSYCCNYSAEGYSKGFWAKQSPETMVNQSTGSPNGHNYNLTFSNCKVGVYVTESAGCGIMFTRVKTPGCEIGLEQAPGQGGPGQYLACEFSGKSYGVYTHSSVSNLIQLQQCTVSGGVEINGGELIADNCTFNCNVNIGALARCVFTSNTVQNGTFNNSSLFECKVDNTARQIKALPEYPEELMEIPTTKPAALNLFVVTDDKYGAKAEYITASLDEAQDNTTAIQNALNDAKAAGGGIVYLPSGHYRCNGSLTIPTGVELRGSADIASVPRGQGAVLETYYGEGQADGTPFITMEPKSGLRGISINYPKQDKSIFSIRENQAGEVGTHRQITAIKYPYAVRGNSDCYIVNLAVRTCYQGVDLFTNKCDNHYVDYISGHCFRNVIRVGGNSENGTISNIQCNTIAYAAGDEWKFGMWPNSMQNAGDTGGDGTYSDACYQQNYDELEFFIVGDCKNQNLYNNFLFGSNIGILFQSDGNGGATFHSLGNAVDGVVNTFVFKQIAAEADMINSQLVALNNGHEAYFFRTEEGFNKTVNMFATNNWGGGNHFAQVLGGTVNFILATLQQSGVVDTWTVSGNGKFNIYNSNFKQSIKANANQNVCVYSAIFTPGGSTESDFGAFKNVLPTTWTMTNKSGFKDRTGWHAISFVDLDGKDANGTETMEDWRHAGDKLASRSIDGNMETRWSTAGSQYEPGLYDKNAGVSGSQPSWQPPRIPQFLAVFFNHDHNKSEHINAMILDAGASTSDGPAEWIIDVQDKENGTDKFSYGIPEGVPTALITAFESAGMIVDGKVTQQDPTNTKWRQVASGKGAGALLIAVFPEEDVTGIRCRQMGSKGNYWSVFECYVAMLDGVKVSGIDAIKVNDGSTLVFADNTLIIASTLFDDFGQADVEIYDLSGRKVEGFTATEGRVDLSHLAKGIYAIRVAGTGSASLKIAVR